MRAAMVALLVLTVPPSTAAALVCARPWGSDDVRAAQSLVAGDFGEVHDGYLIARVASADGDRQTTGEILTLDIAVSIQHPSPPTRVAVASNGPSLRFEAGEIYFLSLYRPEDPEIEMTFVDPCGPAFAVGAAEIGSIVGAAHGVEILEPNLLPAATDVPSGPGPWAMGLIAGLLLLSLGGCLAWLGGGLGRGSRASDQP